MINKNDLFTARCVLIDLAAPNEKLSKNKRENLYYKGLCLELAHIIAKLERQQGE